MADRQPAAGVGPVLAADVGQRRTGVAVSDPLRVMPRPLEVIEGGGVEAVARRIGELVRDLGVTTVVVGLPLLPSGDEGDQALYVRGFVAALRAELSVPVELWDESYSTLEAAKRRRDRASRQRGPLDAEAAAVILEEWLREQEYDPPRDHGGATQAAGA